MGNCCRKISNWLCPNPWEGMEIHRYYAYNYNIHSVRLSDSWTQAAAPEPSPVLIPIQPTLTVVPEKEAIESDPLLKKPLLTPKTNPISTTTPKSSPLQLGISAVPPPPPLSLLEIAKQKKLYIEY
jgi:hypothetical protein